MKNTKIASAAIMLALLVTVTGCEGGTDGNRTVIKEPGKTITVIEDESKPAGKPEVSVEKIDRYENMEISDWLDKDTVIVSKENTSLAKMSLAELSDSYPRSLYLYNLNTREYKPLKEQKNVYLGDAALSADKKHLLYNAFTLGDPVYYVMNLDTLKTFGIMGEKIGGAVSAKWAGNEVIGAAYANGAYQASTTGEISVLDELKAEGLYLVEKSKDKIYYNTNYDEALMMLNLTTKETVNLNLNSAYDLLLSPDGSQLLVLKYNGSKKTMILADADGGNQKIIAEGTELGGISWSPDQRRIAYTLKGDADNAVANSLYIYDVVTDKSTRIAVDIQNSATCWSPSGEELVYSEWDGTHYNSSIVHLKAN